MSCIFGSGYGIRLIRLFNSPKSFMKRIVWSFFGIAKDGAAHSERFSFFRTPILRGGLLLFSTFFHRLSAQRMVLSDTKLPLLLIVCGWACLSICPKFHRTIGYVYLIFGRVFAVRLCLSVFVHSQF